MHTPLAGEVEGKILNLQDWEAATSPDAVQILKYIGTTPMNFNQRSVALTFPTFEVDAIR